MARVLRTSEARQNLRDLGRYIAQQSGDRSLALRFLDRIARKCEQYARQPLMGDARPDLGPDVRCFPVGNYVVIYRPLPDGILVLLVVHGARDIPAVFRDLFGDDLRD
jgi:toxin ParE1/3/4